MGIAFRSSTQAHPTSTTASLTLTRPTGVADGDLLLAFAGNTGPGAQAISGWTELKDVAAGGDVQGSMYWKIASAEPTSWACTVATATNMFGMVAAYTGVLASGPIRSSTCNPTVTTSGTTGSTTSPVPTALTGVQATDLVVQMVTVSDDLVGDSPTTLIYPNATTWPGWNQRDKMDIAEATGSSWGGGCGFVDQLGSTAQPRWTVGATSRQWVSMSIALIAAPDARTSDLMPFFM